LRTYSLFAFGSNDRTYSRLNSMPIAQNAAAAASKAKIAVEREGAVGSSNRGMRQDDPAVPLERLPRLTPILN
jgi:hypothetical protein